MKIIRIEMNNFMPFRGDHFIDFPQDEFQNVMLIRGENERGKTSIMNAIRWGFYGSAVGRNFQKIEMPLLVNRVSANDGDWTLMVSITFCEGDHTFTLIREAQKKPLVHIPTSTEDFNTTVTLLKNGDVVQGNLVDKEISQIAPEQVSQFFLFDGESLNRYEELLSDNTDQVKRIKTAIEQVLGVPALVNGRSDLKVILANAQNQQAQALGQMQAAAHLTANQQTWSTELAAAESDRESINAYYSTTRQEIAELEQVVNNSEASFVAKSNLDAARAEVTRCNEIIVKNQSERLSVISNAWLDVLEIKLRSKIAILTEMEKETSATITARALIKRQFDALNASLNSGECSVCHQPIIDEYQHQLKLELAGIADPVDNIEDEYRLKKITVQLEKIRAIQGADAKNRILQYDGDIAAAQVSLQVALNKKTQYEIILEGQNLGDLNSKRSALKNHYRLQGQQQSQIKSCEDRIAKARVELTGVQTSINALDPDGNNIAISRYKLVSDLHDLFYSAIERLRDTLRTRVAERANEAFLTMTNQAAYQGLRINENYGLSIVDGNGQTVTQPAAGASQLVALSLIDGLNRTGRAVGPIIMDTPFARLDMVHRQNVLNYLPTVSSQFVVLVHSGEIGVATDLGNIKARVGVEYSIEAISENESKLVRNL
jgi:DNA sulfur modification protein DndD